LGGRLLLAQVPSEERILITDPDSLVKLGLSLDVKNVYVWSKADLGESRARDSANVETPETWGTGVGYTTVYGYQLLPSSDYGNLARGWPQGSLDTYCGDDSGGPWAFVQIQVPEGASLGLFRHWAYDSDPDQDLWFRVWETCQPYGCDPPTQTLIAENQTLAAIGNISGTKSLNNLKVNNQLAYTVEVEWAGPDQECVGIGLRVRKFQVSWTRQVSPAPATATFNDVPTNHLFFQFVEALAKSGITAGCSANPPLYCPDAPN
jgi:hypothetical protein